MARISVLLAQRIKVAGDAIRLVRPKVELLSMLSARTRRQAAVIGVSRSEPE